jgi:hypothetical protein
MSLRHLILALVLTAVALPASLASADRAIFRSNSYYRTSYYYGEPPTFPPQPKPDYRNIWYKWGYFGAYPAPRTGVGGHYSHRNQYTELRFGSPK